MNERFKALALQAKLKTELWNNTEPFVIYKEDVHNPGGLEKFAELIVRECIQMCDQAAKQSEATLHAILTEKNSDLGPILVAKGAQIQAEKLSKNINEHFFGAE